MWYLYDESSAPVILAPSSTPSCLPRRSRKGMRESQLAMQKKRASTQCSSNMDVNTKRNLGVMSVRRNGENWDLVQREVPTKSE